MAVHAIHSPTSRSTSPYAAAASVSPAHGSECYKTWAGPRDLGPHRRRRVAQRSGDLGVSRLPTAGPAVEPGAAAVPWLDARRSQLELRRARLGRRRIRFCQAGSGLARRWPRQPLESTHCSHGGVRGERHRLRPGRICQQRLADRRGPPAHRHRFVDRSSDDPGMAGRGLGQRRPRPGHGAQRSLLFGHRPGDSRARRAPGRPVRLARRIRPGRARRRARSAGHIRVHPRQRRRASGRPRRSACSFQAREVIAAARLAGVAPGRPHPAGCLPVDIRGVLFAQRTPERWAASAWRGQARFSAV